MIKNFGYFALFIFVPVHEFVIYPVFWKFILIQMNSVSKFIFGLFLLVLYYISLLVIEAIGYHYAANTDEDLKKCFLNQENRGHLPLDFKWFSISLFIGGISAFYMVDGVIQFISSQAPYTMKGLLFGFSFFSLGLFIVLTTLMMLPVSLTVKKWHPVPYGCGVWFYLSVSAVFLIFTILYIILYKKVYKMRRRDEDLHNRHIFAINYYSHYVQYNKEMGASCEPE